MSSELTKNETEFIISRLVSNAKTTADEYKQSKSPFDEGRKFACYEMLDIIKNELEVRGIDPADYGLDIDFSDTFS